MKAISGRLGMNPETLRKWVRQTEIDAGEAPGVSSEERRALRELRRKNRELESAIEILKAATSFRARVQPASPLICEFIDEHCEKFGIVPICRALAVHGVQIAPRTYWAHRLAAASKRALWDTTITEILAGSYEPGADTSRTNPPATSPTNSTRGPPSPSGRRQRRRLGSDRPRPQQTTKHPLHHRH